MTSKTKELVTLDEKKLIATINDKALIEKIQALGGLLYDEDKMTFIEAAYFAEKNVLSLDGKKLLGIAMKKDKLAEDKYEILKFLRNNGYITRFSLDQSVYIRLYQKGFRPGEDRTKYVLKAVKENWKPELEEIEGDITFSNRVRKELLYAYAAKDGIRFIKVNRATLL